MNKNGKNGNAGIDLSAYEDETGLTEKKLDFGLWYLDHLNQIKKILIVLLAAVSAFFWGRFFYTFINYWLYDEAKDNASLAQFYSSGALNHAYFVANQPTYLIFGTVKTFNSGSGKTDFLVSVSNPNPRHLAEFDYYFISGGDRTEKEHSFIFPGDTKYLAVLGSKVSASSGKLALENFSWKRLDQKTLSSAPFAGDNISDWRSFESERLNFIFSDRSFEPVSEGGSGLNRLRFTFYNDSAYNFWEVRFLILAMRMGDVHGANRYVAPEVMSGEKRDVEFFWPGFFGRIDNLFIQPEVNILDRDAYLKYEGEGSGGSGVETGE